MVQQGDWDLAQHLGCYILPFHQPCGDQTCEQAWEQQKEQKKKGKTQKNGNYAWQSSEMCQEGSSNRLLPADPQPRK